jgi:2-(1,2-epoxy-1,2-dihydrophenyl)acetyl-CoA isomerase
MSGEPLVRVECVVEHGARVARLTLNRPARHNSLVPELLDALHEALDRIEREDLVAVVLAANGRSFSSGGDVAGFAQVARGARRAYAGALVGSLNRAILRLIELPCPLIVRLHGLATGGACGFVFAADLVAMAPEAFLAPYYVDVGFAPDGGWTALLPERIGAARAAAIQLLNRRVSAAEALALGLASEIAPQDALDARIAAWIATLASKVPSSIAATRALLMPPWRAAAIRAGLAREREHFMDLIESPQAEAGMARFLARRNDGIATKASA